MPCTSGYGETLIMQNSDPTKIHFNEHGNLVAPEGFWEANREYWRKIEPMLDGLSVLELRALTYYLTLDTNLTAYILRNQVKVALNREREQYEGQANEH